MSFSSESGFMKYSEIRVNGIRYDKPNDNILEPCVDLLILFKERNEDYEPGVHISLPLNKANIIARDMLKEVKEYYDNKQA